MASAPRVLVYALLVVLALLWGIAFVGIKEALDEISPATLTILRFAVADGILLAMIAAVPALRPRFARRDLGLLVLLSLAGVPGYHLALNYGEQRVSASVASLIVATAPVMVALASSALLRERVPAVRALGIALAFAGVAVLAFTGHGESGARTSTAGILIALLAPVAWAIYTIAAKPMTARAGSMQITAGSMLLGSIGLLPLLRADTFREAAAMSAKGWGWVLLLGAGSSVLGYVIFVFALSKMTATRVSVFLYMVPVVALVTAWAILDEPLGVGVGASAALVVAGVALAQREPTAQRPRQPAEPPRERIR